MQATAPLTTPPKLPTTTHYEPLHSTNTLATITPSMTHNICQHNDIMSMLMYTVVAQCHMLEMLSAQLDNPTSLQTMLPYDLPPVLSVPRQPPSLLCQLPHHMRPNLSVPPPLTTLDPNPTQTKLLMPLPSGKPTLTIPTLPWPPPRPQMDCHN